MRFQKSGWKSCTLSCRSDVTGGQYAQGGCANRVTGPPLTPRASRGCTPTAPHPSEEASRAQAELLASWCANYRSGSVLRPAYPSPGTPHQGPNHSSLVASSARRAWDEETTQAGTGRNPKDCPCGLSPSCVCGQVQRNDRTGSALPMFPREEPTFLGT